MNNIDKLMSQDSSVYARYLIGRVSHKMFWAQQKEMARYQYYSPAGLCIVRFS